ncbi:MAG: D-glycero-beta-D-manno-heptose 1-phosphate adenylyltransferase [Candidatus Omnitrophica bacterium]|nr:D-glycero-beta-D-manno-heptose 1-phosphate adenylyltransferase [Candidatus Omnitrophota bacterium]
MAQEKIKPLSELVLLITDKKKEGKKVVFTNGCFDLLHAGHVQYLEEARRMGDFLIVGLNSDRSVRALKGTARPINTQTARAVVLAALECVDYVTIFNEADPLALITALKPDVLVKGSDWPADQVIGSKEVKADGGVVKTIRYIPGYSTSNLIEKIRSLEVCSE